MADKPFPQEMNIAVLRKLLLGGYGIEVEESRKTKQSKARITCNRCKRFWYVNVRDIPKIPRVDFERIISGHICQGGGN